MDTVELDNEIIGKTVVLDENCISEEELGESRELSPPDDIFLPIPYHLRFTFSDQDKDLKCLEDKQFISRCKTIHQRLIEKMKENQYFHQHKYTSGFEVRNKQGENCKAHIHICFRSTAVKATIDRCVKRYLADTYDQCVVGNQAKMFKEWTQLRDIDSFWRYPLKQNYNPKVCGGHPREYLELQHQVAKESYAKTVQINQAKLDKKDTNDTLFQRVINKLQKTTDNISRKTIALEFINTYIEEDRPLNRQTITGYTLNACVKLGILTPEALLAEWGY